YTRIQEGCIINIVLAQESTGSQNSIVLYNRENTFVCEMIIPDQRNNAVRTRRVSVIAGK
ncbi:hypothetical protein, partial [Staphylococcus aureus]